MRKKRKNIISIILILIFSVSIVSLGTYAFLDIVLGFILNDSYISDIASIGEGIAAIVGAILIVYQLDKDREVEEYENRIHEANFIVHYNQTFIENKEMQNIQKQLTLHVMKVRDLEKNWDDDELQDFINYLVYLEGLAPLVLNKLLSFDNIDNLFAYRYFIAVNNPVLQRISLNAYGNYYKGCYKIYKKWRDYRVNTYCNEPYNERYIDIIPLADTELDQMSTFKRYADFKVDIRKLKLKYRQLSNYEKISNSKLYDIAKLIYDTDPYIYPAMFNNKSTAIETISLLFKSNKDAMFLFDNLYVVENNDEVIGIILWKKGQLDWSETLFKDTLKKNDFQLSENFDSVVSNYINSYNDDSLKETISIINCCIKKEYQGCGIGFHLLNRFIQEHDDEQMELCVLNDNEGAKKLYRKNGFVDSEIYKGFAVEEDMRPDVLKMVRNK